jgi:hypothetical protein
MALKAGSPVFDARHGLAGIGDYAALRVIISGFPILSQAPFALTVLPNPEE